MANFFTDNEDIQFLFEHMDIAHTAELVEDGFRYAEEFDFAPTDADDAVDNYRRILETIGEITGDRIAPTAEETDLVGNTLNDDGSVTYAPGIADAIKALSQADMMGFTLPYRFGGINCPQLVYTMSNEMISRADAALMNIYGLQGIAETINAFASEEIKAEFLPDMASGKHTGAMVLTEPDAGSDLQAVKTQAYQDEDGNWFVHGVKRFITNGCGEVLLVLSRTEPEITDGRGLSLLVVERGPKVKIRRLENKLGIHGSPTCEIFFDDAPAKLIGERQRGLITYVMSLMNGARIGIAAQSLGIGEAAYRVARDYAHSRKQFDTAIENFPAVRELLVNMSLDVQAARALTYHATFSVDIENDALRKTELEGAELDAAQRKALKQTARKYKRHNTMLTPMAKYYASEMSMRVSNDSMAVLGGSGYMKDYPVERNLRDARITTIYEGTSQLQVIAAVRGVASGTCRTVVEEILDRDWPKDLADLVKQIRDGLDMLDECIVFVKEAGMEYMDLVGRKIVDSAISLLVGALFCDQATAKDAKKAVAARWLAAKMPEVRMNREMILSGDRQIISDFDVLAGPVPVVE
ncbi:MAG: acyl-CoA dehydrogenase family protein [Planctomycetota bacterium]|jgi:alkylation response protein AidB-like acyl-CoA dehydrogenase